MGGTKGGKHNVRPLSNGFFEAEFNGCITTHRNYDLARQWAANQAMRAAVEPVHGRHSFASWSQIAEILEMSTQQAESMGLRALVKIREALLDDPVLPSLMEHLGIRTREHG